jgi:hypothetical protein
MLRMDFDANGVGYEGAYSRGDSGGVLFVKVGTKWLLAGVSYSADGPYSTPAMAPNAFDASLFDRGGLWFAIHRVRAGPAPQNCRAHPTHPASSRTLTGSAAVLSGTIPPKRSRRRRHRPRASPNPRHRRRCRFAPLAALARTPAPPVNRGATFQ